MFVAERSVGIDALSQTGNEINLILKVAFWRIPVKLLGHIGHVVVSIIRLFVAYRLLGLLFRACINFEFVKQRPVDEYIIENKPDITCRKPLFGIGFNLVNTSSAAGHQCVNRTWSSFNIIFAIVRNIKCCASGSAATIFGIDDIIDRKAADAVNFPTEIKSDFNRLFTDETDKARDTLQRAAHGIGE